MVNILELTINTLASFCCEFLNEPYLAYTEHGIHALYFNQLFCSLPEEHRYIYWEGHKVSVLQKEYPTASNLGKPQRQHWDIALIKNPPVSQASKYSYDYLKLAAVIEFGLNEAEDHLVDDIERLCHADSNVDQGFLVHLYRISEPGAMFSNRDWSSKTTRMITPSRAAQLTIGKPIEIFYALADSTNQHKSGAYWIKDGQIQPLVSTKAIAGESV